MTDALENIKVNQEWVKTKMPTLEHWLQLQNAHSTHLLVAARQLPAFTYS
jgi:hypothetical protein